MQVSEDDHLRVFEQHRETYKWGICNPINRFAWEVYYSRRYTWLGAEAYFPWTPIPSLDGEVSLTLKNVICSHLIMSMGPWKVFQGTVVQG